MAEAAVDRLHVALGADEIYIHGKIAETWLISTPNLRYPMCALWG